MLLLSAHPDDAEVGAGGTIARFIEEGWRVSHAVFCASEHQGQETLSKALMLAEFDSANELLGVAETIKFDFPHRRLNEVRQDVLEEMSQLKRDIDPSLILMPGTSDIHQDHGVISAEGLRAFKKRNLWGFETIWNNLMFDSRTFVMLQERHIQQKLAVMREYKTQQFRDYFQNDFIVSLARVRGKQIGQEYAEAFECVRGII